MYWRLGMFKIPQNLIPLTKFEGPLLKLSSRDKGIIWNLQKTIYGLEKRVMDIQRELGLPGLTSADKFNLKQQLTATIERIRDLHLQIRDAKRSAYARQCGN